MNESFEKPRDLHDQEREDALDIAERAYTEKGYTFTRYPHADLLPDALGGEMPDAMAIRPGRNILIDVSATGARVEGKRGRIFGAFADSKPGWEFHPIIVPT